MILCMFIYYWSLINCKPTSPHQPSSELTGPLLVFKMFRQILILNLQCTSLSFTSFLMSSLKSASFYTLFSANNKIYSCIIKHELIYVRLSNWELILPQFSYYGQVDCVAAPRWKPKNICFCVKKYFVYATLSIQERVDKQNSSWIIAKRNLWYCICMNGSFLNDIEW